MSSLFDRDYIKINDLSFKDGMISLLMIVMILFVLCLIRKDLIYHNEIVFVDSKKAILVVDSNMIEKVKEEKQLDLNAISYDYNIEKIEEKEKIYLLYIEFNIELENISAKTYYINLGKESIMQYIIRIMKGKTK